MYISASILRHDVAVCSICAPLVYYVPVVQTVFAAVSEEIKNTIKRGA
jgi:hypothetical protein